PTGKRADIAKKLWTAQRVNGPGNKACLSPRKRAGLVPAIPINCAQLCVPKRHVRHKAGHDRKPDTGDARARRVASSSRRMLEFLQAKRKRDVNAPGEYRGPADDPDHRQSAGAW